MSQKKALIIDGNNYLNRGHWGTPPLTNSDGMQTNGILGFINILLADLEALDPNYLAVTFDKGGKPNWRKELYPDYKANREARKADAKIAEQMQMIYAQKPYLSALLRYIGIRVSSVAGQEADDIIGTLCTRFTESDVLSIIGSKDKDFAQLVSKSVVMLDAKDRTLIDVEGIKRIYGVHPKQIVSYLALLGDTSDNIPGVKGCGEKTAAKLLQEHKTLKGVNKAVLTPKLRSNFNLVRSNFNLTRKLLTIKTDLELGTRLQDCVVPTQISDPEKFNQLCNALSLNTVKRSLLNQFQ